MFISYKQTSFHTEASFIHNSTTVVCRTFIARSTTGLTRSYHGFATYTAGRYTLVFDRETDVYYSTADLACRRRYHHTQTHRPLSAYLTAKISFTWRRDDLRFLSMKRSTYDATKSTTILISRSVQSRDLPKLRSFLFFFSLDALILIFA